MMIKRTKEIVNLFKDKYDINVTFEPFSLNNEELDDLSEKLYYKVFNVKKVDFSIIYKLKKIISRHPDIPIFYNFLYGAYHNNGKVEVAAEILEEVNRKFPDYIFGITQRTTRFIYKDLLDDAYQWIGTEMDIKKRFPRDYYHYAELKSYYLVFFELALKEGDKIKAKSVLKILWELFPNENDLAPFAVKYFAELYIYYDHSYTSTMDIERIPLDIPEQVYDQEIFDLITYEDLDNELDRILKYKEDYLCAELYKICISFYHNFDSLGDDDYVTVIEAFKLLSTTNYNVAFPLFITYLSQDKCFVDYFWEEADDSVVEIAFNFGKNNPDLLLDFLMNEKVDDMIKAAIFKALVQLVLHDFLSKEKLTLSYQQMMDKYLSSLRNGLFVPTFLITMVIPEAIKLNDFTLLEKVEPFFHAKKVDTSYYGTYEDQLNVLSDWELKYVKKYFPKDLKDYLTGEYLKLNQTKPLSDQEKILFNLANEDKFELFLLGSLTKDFSDENSDDDGFGYRDEDDDDSEIDMFKNSEPIVKSNKIGRNDPCPCGSGKKFKKCCINNGIFK